MNMNCMDLFAGIGGFALAERWMGWETKVCVEIDPYCQRILKHHFPKSEIHGDIKTFDGTKYRGTIDLITGGFPCQPFSSAGKRKGTSDDRYLWPEMLRVIREVAPRWIVGENVRGLVNWSGGLVFEQVCADLEAEGYEVQPFILPACAVGAPHRRERIWFVAYFNKCTEGPSRTSAGTFEQRSYNNDEPKEWREQTEQRFRCSDVLRNATDTNTGRFKECWPKWFTSRELTQDYGLTSEPGICRGDDGFPYRVDRLKALGNAIVPQVALQIFKAINLHAASYGWR